MGTTGLSGTMVIKQVEASGRMVTELNEHRMGIMRFI